jgi:hypothetical protein
MTAKLKAAFGDPQHGSITLTISSDSQTISIAASFIYDGLLQLTYALHTLFFSPAQAIVTWTTEPIEYEMCFESDGEVVRFELHEYAASRRSSVFNPSLLSTSGSYDEVCRPFWRALRALQGRCSEQEFQERMGLPFPSAELEKLTQALKSQVGPKK